MLQPDPGEDVSRSQRKRDALAVRSLAAELVAMSAAQLRGIPLDEPLLGAVAEARRIRSNIARKRQLQYIAKLMRRMDIGPIIAALESGRAEARRLTARHHRAEAWRDRLLAGGDNALTELMDDRPGLDTQAVRHCVRKAAAEDRNHQPPAAARELFRILRDLDRQRPLPPCPDSR